MAGRRAGVGLALAAAWTDLADVGVAIVMLLPFLLPGSRATRKKRRQPPTLARSMLRASMWAGAGLSGLVLVLTLVILLGSIDQIHFAAHEVYTSVLIAAAGGAFVVYGTRDEDPSAVLVCSQASRSSAPLGSGSPPGGGAVMRWSR